MNRNTKFFVVLCLIGLTSLKPASGNTVKDTAKTTIVFVGNLEKNEGVCIINYDDTVLLCFPQGQARYVIDSTHLVFGPDKYPDKIGIVRIKRKRSKVYWILLEPPVNNYLIVQRDKRLKRKYRYNWYWLEDIRFVRGNDRKKVD